MGHILWDIRHPHVLAENTSIHTFMVITCAAALANTQPCHHSQPQSYSCSSPSPAAQQSKLVFYLIPLLQATEVLKKQEKAG